MDGERTVPEGVQAGVDVEGHGGGGVDGDDDDDDDDAVVKPLGGSYMRAVKGEWLRSRVYKGAYIQLLRRIKEMLDYRSQFICRMSLLMFVSRSPKSPPWM